MIFCCSVALTSCAAPTRTEVDLEDLAKSIEELGSAIAYRSDRVDFLEGQLEEPFAQPSDDAGEFFASRLGDSCAVQCLSADSLQARNSLKLEAQDGSVTTIAREKEQLRNYKARLVELCRQLRAAIGNREPELDSSSLPKACET